MKNKLQMLEEKSKIMKSLFLNTFSHRCDPGMFIVKQHLLDNMARTVRIFETPSVLDNSLFEDFSVHDKQACRRTLQRR